MFFNTLLRFLQYSQFIIASFKFSERQYEARIQSNLSIRYETAHILIHSPRVSEGYTALWERGRLDLTVEALIWDNPEYHEFFTKDELRIVRKRLIDYQYGPAIKK